MQPPQPAGAYVGTARQFTVHWADLARCLPVENDSAAKARRRELFETFDPQGQGILSQARVVKALFRLMPNVSGITDMWIIIHQAFGVARDIVAPITPIGVDRMDRNQFRVLMIYLWHFFKLWDIFAQLNMGTDNRKVTQKQFEEMLPWVRAWGVKDAGMWATNPDACFESVDRNRQGWVVFEDFAEFILRHAVPQLCADGEEEGRAEAVRLLRRTNPQLLQKESAGKALAVPPPGQRRPPVRLDDKTEGGMPSPQWRYRTSYMSDYISPQNLPSEGTTASSTPARSCALSRALTPTVTSRRPASDVATGIALVRSSSEPVRTVGLDKNALRSKLENHLDMYSTGQMRKLLQVAGGMVLEKPGPTNPNGRVVTRQ